MENKDGATMDPKIKKPWWIGPLILVAIAAIISLGVWWDGR